MDWNDLRFVLALHRERTLAATARRLNLQHSTVGRRLAILERDLGARLFDRTPDGYRLTPVGLKALAALERIDGTVAELERAVVTQSHDRDYMARLANGRNRTIDTSVLEVGASDRRATGVWKA